MSDKIAEVSGHSDAAPGVEREQQTKLPPVKELQAALLYGLDSNQKPRRQQGAGDWLQSTSWVLVGLFFLSCLLIAILHYARKPFDQIVHYIYSPLIFLTFLSYVAISLRGGARFANRIRTEGWRNPVDRQLHFEEPLIKMLQAYSSRATLDLSERLHVEVESDKDLVSALTVAAIILAALMTACVTDIAVKNKFLSACHPVIALFVWLFAILFASLKLVGDIRVERRLAWVLLQASKALP